MGTLEGRIAVVTGATFGVGRGIARCLLHNLKLSDAQELIANKAGFENWEAVLKGVIL